jgi:hypothetical protein
VHDQLRGLEPAALGRLLGPGGAGLVPGRGERVHAAGSGDRELGQAALRRGGAPGGVLGHLVELGGPAVLGAQLARGRLGQRGRGGEQAHRRQQGGEQAEQRRRHGGRAA